MATILNTIAQKDTITDKSYKEAVELWVEEGGEGEQHSVIHFEIVEHNIINTSSSSIGLTGNGNITV